MPTSFAIKQNDTAPSLQATLLQGDGSVQDLTGAIITFSLQRVGYPSVMVITDAVCSLVGAATAGTVLYAWQAGDTAVVGLYQAEFHVRLPDGRTITFPTGGELPVYVMPGLP